MVKVGLQDGIRTTTLQPDIATERRLQHNQICPLLFTPICINLVQSRDLTDDFYLFKSRTLNSNVCFGSLGAVVIKYSQSYNI